MDINKIKLIIKEQLSNLSDLDALKVENHIYGCYIIMQDIAEKTLSLSNHLLTKKLQDTYFFNIDHQFSQIGIRFGFVMDSLLLFDSFLPSYKDLWLDIFNDISLTMDMELVDNIEETINECLVDYRSLDKSFFFAASQGGFLPQEYVDRIIDLIHPSLSYKPISTVTENKSSLLTTASTETPARNKSLKSSSEQNEIRVHSSKFKKLQLTRKKLRVDLSNKSFDKLNKKYLSKTRRVHFK